MADIFISYKREDRKRIVPLVRILESHGYTVWWDLEIVAGQKWGKTIKAELDAAKCVIVVWTRASIAKDQTYASDWVENEADSAHRRGVLVPVLLDEGRVAWTHQRVQFASLVGWTGDPNHNGVADLMKGVNQHAGARSSPEAVELAAWTTAERNETAEAFGEFLVTYPNSRFGEVARGRVAELGEAAKWAALGSMPTISALEGFLRRYPIGRFADDAKAKLKALEVPRLRQPDALSSHNKPSSAHQAKHQSSRAHLGPRTLAILAALVAIVGLAAVASMIAPNYLRPQSPGSAYALEFDHLEIERTFDGSTPILIVRGIVRNTVSAEALVPPIVVVLLDDRAREISRVEQMVTTQRLAAGAELPFEIRVENPPPDATNVETIFAAPVATPSPPTNAPEPTLESAAQEGDAIAQYELALSLLSDGRTSDGVAMLRQAAEGGLAIAQYRLAKLYERGEGVPVDLATAHQWTSRAAAAGNRRAMHDLGVYFARGEGASLNETEAARWFRQAAELGVADSQYNLGVLYQQGRGVNTDTTEALYWFLVAASQGDQDAGTRGRALEAQLTAQQIQQARTRAEAFRPRPADALANGQFGDRSLTR